MPLFLCPRRAWYLSVLQDSPATTCLARADENGLCNAHENMGIASLLPPHSGLALALVLFRERALCQGKGRRASSMPEPTVFVGGLHRTQHRDAASGCGLPGCTKAVTLEGARRMAQGLGTTHSIQRRLPRHSITRARCWCPCCSLAASVWQTLANSHPLDAGRRPKASSCSP